MMVSTRRNALVLVATLVAGLPVLARGQSTGSIKQILANAESAQGVFNVNWAPEGGVLDVQRDQNLLTISSVDPVTGARTAILSDSAARDILTQYNQLNKTSDTTFPFSGFSWARLGHVMMFSDQKGTQYVYIRSTRTLRKLMRPKPEVPKDADALMRDMAGSQLVNGTYSPDYSRIGYIRDYDLYVMNTATGDETRLTTGGTEQVMNGRPDWVYPEELEQTEAFFWSPDGRKIAYLQFDERPVIPYPIIHDAGQDATVEWERYPKAGANNPVVRLFIIDVDTKQTVQVDTKSSGNVYIMRPTWTPDGKELLFQRMNRHQDTLELLAANPTTGAARRILIEHDPAYVNAEAGGSTSFGGAPPPIRFLADGKRFLWPSERSGWRHWYLYDLGGKELAQVTKGNRVFTNILAVDEAQGVLYTRAITDEGQEAHLFRAKLDGSGVTQLTEPGGVHSIRMDPTGRYYLDIFSSPTHPPTAELFNSEGKQIKQMGAVTYNLQGITLTSPEYVTVKAADKVTNLHGRLYKPVGFDSTKKYPLIVQVYGGPRYQQVQHTSVVADENQMLAQDGYMVWVVDNRGTPNRGRDFERATYLKLGQVDMDDQAVAVQQLTRTHRYIDSTRVGIIGSSFGGYLSALALLRYPNVFQVGVAMSAVTDWRYYDTIYTERYMRTPQENPKGYDAGSTLTYVNNLSGHLLIMHGTADNNVHLANALQLQQGLIMAGKQTGFLLYPEARHGVPGQAGMEFLAKYLQPVPVQQ